jgi:hypothetical protein
MKRPLITLGRDCTCRECRTEEKDHPIVLLVFFVIAVAIVAILGLR